MRASKFHPFSGLGAITENYASRPGYASGVKALTYLFHASEKTAPLRPSLLSVPFASPEAFLAFVGDATVWSLGDDIDSLMKDGSLVEDEVNGALLAASDKLTEFGGVFTKQEGPQFVYRALQAEAASFKLRNITGGVAYAAYATATETIPQAFETAREAVSTVTSDVKSAYSSTAMVAKIAPFAGAAILGLVFYKYLMAPYMAGRAAGRAVLSRIKR